MRHHRRVIPEAVQAEALTHVAVDRQTHVRACFLRNVRLLPENRLLTNLLSD
jgi:hypothetical protein